MHNAEVQEVSAHVYQLEKEKHRKMNVMIDHRLRVKMPDRDWE